jgi:hypothetical protein
MDIAWWMVVGRTDVDGRWAASARDRVQQRRVAGLPCAECTRHFRCRSQQHRFAQHVMVCMHSVAWQASVFARIALFVAGSLLR